MRYLWGEYQISTVDHGPFCLRLRAPLSVLVFCQDDGLWFTQDRLVGLSGIGQTLAEAHTDLVRRLFDCYRDFVVRMDNGLANEYTSRLWKRLAALVEVISCVGGD